VIFPAQDGGYVLIGLRRPRAELFRDVPWGGPAVLRITLGRARACAMDLRLLPPWYDVDDAGGLRRLRADLAAAGGSPRAPRTARVLDSLGSRVV
jgi:glycosyltransferase A (GT-A) superfamily protein (DUF2064 family)